MGYLIMTKDRDDMRESMRSRYRGGMYRHDGYSPTNHQDSEHWYKKGYEDGHEDAEEEISMRRRRNSLGQYV